MDAKIISITSTTQRIQAHCLKTQEICKRILDRLEAQKAGK